MPKTEKKPITRIIRFMAPDGKVYQGEEPEGGVEVGKQAEVLSGDLYRKTLKRTGQKLKVKRILSPIVPTDIFCIALNYQKHYEESAKKRGIPLPEKPAFFMKPSSTLAHPGQDVWMPGPPSQITHGEQLDWEVELTIVIGKPCRNVSVEDALKYVAGYTVANDVSSRHWQKNAGANQFVKGKSFDTFGPFGPVLVTTEEITDPQNLGIITRVKREGKEEWETQQDENTKDMIFTCAQQIAWMSNNMTLLPGAVIETGTPSGVATGRDPPNWLCPGDIVEVECEKIGKLRNKITNPPEDADKAAAKILRDLRKTSNTITQPEFAAKDGGRRRDPTDPGSKKTYTRAQFIEFYGKQRGASLWGKAGTGGGSEERRRDPTAPKSKKTYTRAEFNKFYGAAQGAKMWKKAASR